MTARSVSRRAQASKLHTYPFKTRGEAGTSSATKTRLLDLRDDLYSVSYGITREIHATNPVMALQDDLLCLVPIAVLLRTLQIRTVVAVQVLENPVLVLQAAICPLRRAILHGRQRPPLGSRLGGSSRKARGSRSSRKSSVGDGAERLGGRHVPYEHLDGDVEQCSRN